jgi:anti-sigma B factor antagonist
MKVSMTAETNVAIVKICGRLDASNTKEYKEMFQTYLKTYALFVLDLTELEFLDSTGLGAIISSLKQASEASGDIAVANLQPKPKMLFEITRAHKIFNVFNDIDSAVFFMQNRSSLMK